MIDMQESDFSFSLSETVAIGSREAVVRGQATFCFREDEFLLTFLDENNLPCERWFPESMISQLRKHS